MPYVDYKFYCDEYKGIPITEEEFNRLVGRASDLIDMITHYVLVRKEFTHFAQLIQTNVKKAVSAQVEYMFQNGGESLIHGNPASSVSIGSFSYQEKSEGLGIISPIVIEYLKPLGLLYSELIVHG